MKKLIIFIFIIFFTYGPLSAQDGRFKQGILFKTGSSLRIGSVKVLNKRSLTTVSSDIHGVFKIASKYGDTLQFTSDFYQTAEEVVANFTDQVIYLDPIIKMDEVVIKGSSLQSNINEAKLGYRKKGVFYTGRPHYYYLFLKPMTFIYENFKSEVKDARRFDRYAKKSIAANNVYKRFNSESIKRVIPISESQLESFELEYLPTPEQINSMNDYDLARYIKKSYNDFLIKLQKPKSP